MNKKLVYGLLLVSIGINIAVLFIDTVPFMTEQIKRRYPKDKSQSFDNVSHDHIETKVLERAINMAKSEEVTMIWNERRGFTQTMFDWVRKENKRNFQLYNYPRAYLYYGLSEYLINKNDEEQLVALKNAFDQFIVDTNGEPKFELNKVDQVPFGLTAINLYSHYSEQKYKKFADHILTYVSESVDVQTGLVPYREGIDNYLNDVIGMIVPFLANYHKLTGDTATIELARYHLDYFIEYGLDKRTMIPSHGIAFDSKTKTGSINWGRGIGWYLLGLSAVHRITNDYESELSQAFQSLKDTKINGGLYSQFPGSSEIFDASTSTLFLYSFSSLSGFEETKRQIITSLAPYVDDDGSLLRTSGDTYSLNYYSRSFGLSELSQGILLLLLS